MTPILIRYNMLYNVYSRMYVQVHQRENQIIIIITLFVTHTYNILEDMTCNYILVIWHVHIILVNTYRSRSKETVT